MMFRLTPVVKFVLIVIVAVYILSILLVSNNLGFIPASLALHSVDSGLFKPYQIFTYMLMHDYGINDPSRTGTFMHILFNMFMFVSFGPQLESFLGSKRFGNFIMICGLGVGASWLLWNYLASHGYINMAHSEGAMLGFSGVLFGIFSLMGLYFPETQVQLIIPPIPVKLKYLVLAYIGYEFYYLIRMSDDNISHISHLLGVLFAVIMYNFWHYWDTRNR